jgi:hypothetical protein
VINAYVQRRTLPDVQLIEEFLWYVGPHIAELHVQHRDYSGNLVACELRFAIRNGYQGLRRQRRSHLLKADDTGCQTRSGVSEHIAAVKSMRVFGAGTSVDAFIDLAQGVDAVAFGHQRQ